LSIHVLVLIDVYNQGSSSPEYQGHQVKVIKWGSRLTVGRITIDRKSKVTNVPRSSKGQALRVIRI